MVWTPCELDAVDLKGGTAVVVDVLRASTSMLAALEAGALRILPAATEAEARALASRLPRRVVLLCGEREGVRIEGFDRGNSPLEYTAERVSGRTLVYCTTNGTPALRRAARKAREVLVACFRNLGAVAEELASRPAPHVIVCAGRQGRVSLDDALCAGHLALRLRGAGADRLCDGARTALSLAECLGPPTPELVARAAGGRALIELGFQRDVAFCAEMDRSGVVPVLSDGAVVGKRG